MTNAQVEELKYLEYFYDRAREAMGPADDDIYQMIAEDYEATTGRETPKKYNLRDE